VTRVRAARPRRNMGVDCREGAEIEGLWRKLLTEFGWGNLPLCHTAEEAARLPGVPPAWVEVLAGPERVAKAVAQWRGMPRFSSYLESSTLDVRLVAGPAEPVMAYLIKDWKETDAESHEPGLMIGGVITPAATLDAFQAEVGELPVSLRTAWLAHSYVSLKSGRWLNSLLAEDGEESRRPRVIPAKASQGWVGGVKGHFECLEILDVGRAVSGCLVRAPGERAWRDQVVYRHFDGHLRQSHRPTLEETFTDWEATEWEGP
jgi:hypothetical protein